MIIKIYALNAGWHRACTPTIETGGSMAMQKNILSKLSGFIAIAFLCLTGAAQADEFSPFGGSARSSNFQMQQAQEAIRNICSCVVGNQTMNPNCGALTAAAVQNQNMNPYGQMPGQVPGQFMGASNGHGVNPTMGNQQIMNPGLANPGMAPGAVPQTLPGQIPQR
jgi:hypothetical protein